MLREVQRYWAAGTAEKVALVALAGAIAVCSCVGLFAVGSIFLSGSPSLGTRAQVTNTAGAQGTPTVKPTATPQVVHYPPTTQADLRGLAAKGDAGAIHEVHSEIVGLVATCPQPKREVVVDPSVTGQQLAEDLLAYFYGQRLDNPCGSLVLSYHDQSEVGDVYTAGRIITDVTDSSGQANVDPNATNLKYRLTLDIGGVLSSQQEYVVTY